MEQLARTATQIGAVLKRQRKKQNLSQTALGEKINIRQATISKLESGDPGTKLGTLLDTLLALNLELVIRHRTRSQAVKIEDIF